MPQAAPTEPVRSDADRPNFTQLCSALFAPGGPYQQTHQPVVLWVAGQIVASNDAAVFLSKALAEPSQALQDALSAVATGKRQFLEAVPLGGTSTKPAQYLDLDLLPAGEAILIQG